MRLINSYLVLPFLPSLLVIAGEAAYVEFSRNVTVGPAEG